MSEDKETKTQKPSNILDYYRALSPMSKKIANATIVLVAVLILYTVYVGFQDDKKITETEGESSLFKTEMTGDGDKMLSDRIALQREIDNLNKKVELELNVLRNDNEKLKQQNEYLNNKINSIGIVQDGSQTTNTNSNLGKYPPAPGSENYPQAPNYTTSNIHSQNSKVQIKTSIIGGVRHINIAPPQIMEEKVKAKNNYFTTTTLLKGTLLNGMYAPTLSKGKSNPHPAFIRIDDLSILPNDFRRDIEGCEFMAEAYGELSDSRVHMRLTKLACTAHDGTKYFDGNVQGVVFGEDGTLGVPGEAQANFNKILATSTFMEFFAGFGSAMKYMTSTTVISNEGVAQEYVEGSDWDKAGKMTVAGIGEGINKGFTKISDYYMKVLDDMAPVIHINGGRNVEMKLTGGVELKLQENDWTWADEF